jgi:hypothetical protein
MRTNSWKTATLLAAWIILSGFDLDNAIVAKSDIVSGGPPKDGIPAIVDPKFAEVADVDYLRDSDTVIGVKIGQEARAYPIRILNWHEIVNDTVNGVPIAVTF